MGNIIRCALYDRVSTDMQVEFGISLDAQKQALADYALSHGYKIVGSYTDEGTTARKRMQNRKELIRLLNDVKADKVDLILVTKLDRWFRNIKDYHNTQSILEAHHCNWKTIFEEYDTATSNGRFAINIMLSVNENECDRDSDRIKEVFRYKRTNKEAVSGAHASFGYKVVDKKFVKDESTSHIVEDFFSYYFMHFSKKRTVDYILEKYGDEAPAYTTLQFMFKNAAYAGTIYGIPDYCEPYITLAQFNKIKEMSNLKVYPSKNDPYIFSSLIKCPYCGHNFAGYQHKTVKKSGKAYIYPVYHCKLKLRAKSLCSSTINVYESKVEEYLMNNVEGEVQALKCQLREVSQKREQIAKQPEFNINKIQSEIDRLNILFQKGRISDKYYDEQYDALTEKLRQCKSRCEIIDLKRYEKIFSSFSGDWKEMYLNLDVQHKQSFWHSVIKDININKETRKVCGFHFLP